MITLSTKSLIGQNQTLDPQYKFLSVRSGWTSWPRSSWKLHFSVEAYQGNPTMHGVRHKNKAIKNQVVNDPPLVMSL